MIKNSIKKVSTFQTHRSQPCLASGLFRRSFCCTLTVLMLACLILPQPIKAQDMTEKFSVLAPSLSHNVIKLALKASQCAVKKGVSSKARYLGVIDYSLPSTEKRLWVFDTRKRALLWKEFVSHGKHSGENYASTFSNTPGSLQSSIGLFRTGHSYMGSNGYSLRLYGLEQGINHNAYDRAIVMHGAPYVSSDFLKKYGRLGRSWGCPALRTEVSSKVIETIEDDAFLFVYYPDSDWKTHSKFLTSCE